MNGQTLTPPVANIRPLRIKKHGKVLVDNYAWLQDKNDQQVIEYLTAENDYAKKMLQHTLSLQEQLFQEMRGRIKEDDDSAAERYGEYYYYYRMEAGKQYRIFCRKHGSLEAVEEVLLDENTLAEGLEYCNVFVYLVSPDQNLLAYGIDTTGSRVYDLYVKNLRSGEILSGPIHQTAYTAGWANDNRTLLYTVFDHAHRSYQVFRHVVGSQEADTLVYHETDESFHVRVERTRSGDYLLITTHSASTSEVRYLPADQPMGDFQLLQPRQHWMEYYAEHHGNHFFIWTNQEAENFKLVEVPVSEPSIENWREVIPHREDTLIEDVLAFKDHLVVFERTGGLPQVRISAPDGKNDVRYVAFPEPVYTVSPGGNLEFNTTQLRLSYNSLVTPESAVDYDLVSGAWQVKKVQEIPSGYDPSQYECFRLHATAPDGVKVPISLVYRKGFKQDGSQPLVLYGYGSYGYSSEPRFDAKRLSLLERGFTWAIAHIRGGSELGRAWYEHGRLMHKKNTFTDFIACAEYLIQEKYTSKEKIAILGGSAGGLLVSAVANMRPDLFQAVVALVPFTNVITAMLSPDLPLTVVEWEQWGNPEDAQAFEYMLSYSPYENVAAVEYPHIFAKAGLNDLQVPYWDPAKWVARLRALKTGSNKLLFMVNMGAGHSGSSGRYDYLKEYAQYYAFLIDTVGGS
jgi:oligopeptidase B